MSQNDRLQGLAGIYKQNDGSTFVVILRKDELFLKVDGSNEEKLTPGGDGLYSVGQTAAKLKFHITSQSIAASLTFYLKDRQTVATKDLQVFKEKTLIEKFKELGIAIIIFFALVGAFLLSYSPLKNSCLSGDSKTLCRLALVGSKILGKTKDTLTLSSHESKSAYGQIKEETKAQCLEGDSNACLEMAKSSLRINDKQKAFTILKKSCLEKLDPPACGLWHSSLIDSGDIDQAYEVAKQACSKNIAFSCHQLAWKYKKDGDLPRSLTYFTKACDNGEEKSCHELGLHHLKYNRKLSHSFFTSACKAYHRQSCDLKEKIDKFFIQEKKCRDESIPRSCFIVASFEEDYGDKAQAMKLFKEACTKESRLACDRVRKEEALEKLRKSKDKIETI